MIVQARDIATIFRMAGADVLRPSPGLNAAAQHAPRAEAANLDFYISGQMVFPVAEALTARRVPFVFYAERRPEIVIPDSTGRLLHRDK